LAADIDTAENGAAAATDEGRVKGVAVGRGNAANDPGKGGGVVTGEGPQHAAAGYVGAWDGDEKIEEENGEEASGAGPGVGRLEVDGGEGELNDGAVEDLIEGGDSVEEGDVENESGKEADAELGGDAFGDVALGAGDLFSDWNAGGSGSAFMLTQG
jgi:hypothetical protein